ncbi:MAG: hypothetical protein KBD64_01585 [Gammaproteobacteria bacterium]|nr:hypothetical protein [Gammaproteobacteria bacterium]
MTIMSTMGKTKSVWQKIKLFLGLNRGLGSENNEKIDDDKDQDGKSKGGSNKTKGTGFIDPKLATHVKDPETILYNELKKDPAAMLALKKLTNGQIPSSELAAEFEQVRNSEVALEAIANSPLTPSDIKAKAREQLRRNKQQAQEGFKPDAPTPRPGGM